MKKKDYKELIKVLHHCLYTKTVDGSTSVSKESGESFLEQNARESKAIEVDKMKEDFYRTEHERGHKELDSQLRKLIKKVDNLEKKLEKCDAKMHSVQNEMLDGKEWEHKIEDDIHTLNKQVEKQSKDIHLIKKVFVALEYSNTGVRQGKKFKSIAKQLIKSYNKEGKKLNGKNVYSSKGLGRIEDKGGYNL